jgi:5-methylcytosine-specific restriction endonuclease McrA
MSVISPPKDEFANKVKVKLSIVEEFDMEINVPEPEGLTSVQKEQWNIMSVKEKIHWTKLDEAQKKCNIKSGANKYAFDYMKIHAGKFVRLKDVQEYCNQRTKDETGEGLGDPPRAFEILRKDILPLEWEEKKEGRYKSVKYNPDLKRQLTAEICESYENKKDSFSKEIITKQMENAGYKCEITGLPVSEGKLAADHFLPKEKGGKSEENNCVILNKVLNEKKNKKMPIEWFCDSLLTNFMNICKKVGLLEECKEKFIKFVQEF